MHDDSNNSVEDVDVETGGDSVQSTSSSDLDNDKVKTAKHSLLLTARKTATFVRRQVSRCSGTIATLSQRHRVQETINSVCDNMVDMQTYAHFLNRDNYEIPRQCFDSESRKELFAKARSNLENFRSCYTAFFAVLSLVSVWGHTVVFLLFGCMFLAALYIDTIFSQVSALQSVSVPSLEQQAMVVIPMCVIIKALDGNLATYLGWCSCAVVLCFLHALVFRGPKYTGYHRVLSPEHQQHISPTSNYDPIERTHAAHNDDDDDDEPSEGTAMTDEQVVAVADMLDDALADILQRSTMDTSSDSDADSDGV